MYTSLLPIEQCEDNSQRKVGLRLHICWCPCDHCPVAWPNSAKLQLLDRRPHIWL